MKNIKKKKMTANEFTNVKDISGKFLYSKDDHLFGYLRIYPFNLDLLSRAEKEVLTSNLSASFDGDRRDFVYQTFPREIDLDDYKTFLKEEYRSELKDIGRRKILGSMIKEAIQLSTSGENFEHQHFVKVWTSIGNNLNDAKHELLTRLEEFKTRYEAVGMRVDILDEDGIIKLCNMYGNGRQASFDLVDENTIYAAIPQIRG